LTSLADTVVGFVAGAGRLTYPAAAVTVAREVGTRAGQHGEGRMRSARPSPATVISLVALFVALAGTAYALERGEVQAKHIAADAVRAKHVKDEAIGGAAVNESTLEQVPDAASADALQGLALAEVTGDAAQLAAGAGTVSLAACDIVHGQIATLTLPRPARILVFSSATFNNGDADVDNVDAVVELRSGTTTVATSPTFTTPLNSEGDARYDVVGMLRTGANSVEIPAGTYSLRTVVDSSPVCEGTPGLGPERLGYVVVGAR
jgi:hypothetical protein